MTDLHALMLRLFKRIAVAGPAKCWEWQGYRQPSGHGHVKVGGRALKSHRVVYELFHGPLERDEVVRHLCGNAACCNPSHLAVGTRQENAWDSQRHRTFPQNGARLDADTVIELRERYALGFRGFKALGSLYGVSEATASDIVHRRTWRDVEYRDCYDPEAPVPF